MANDDIVLDFEAFKSLCWKTMRRSAAKPFVNSEACRAWAENEYGAIFQKNFEANPGDLGFLAGCLSCSARAGIRSAELCPGAPRISTDDFEQACGDTKEFVMRNLTRAPSGIPRQLDGVCM